MVQLLEKVVRMLKTMIRSWILSVKPDVKAGQRGPNLGELLLLDFFLATIEPATPPPIAAATTRSAIVSTRKNVTLRRPSILL